MKKIDLLLLHVPLVGLAFMFSLMDKCDENAPTYAQSKLPLLIQLVSVVVVILIAVF